MIALGGIGDVGRRTGLYMNVLAVGALLGPPISGAISEASGGYSAVGCYAGKIFSLILCRQNTDAEQFHRIYTGSMIIVSAIAMSATKYLVLGNLTGIF